MTILSIISPLLNPEKAVQGQGGSAGGESLQEPVDQFYGDRKAGIKDPDGKQWWIATRIEDLSPEELEKRAQAFYETA